MASRVKCDRWESAAGQPAMLAGSVRAGLHRESLEPFGVPGRTASMNEKHLAELLDRAATCIAEARAELLENTLASDLAEFIATECHKIDGARVRFVDFYEEFAAFSGRRHNKTLLASRFPDLTPYGIGSHNIRYIGNCWLRSMGTPPAPGPRLVQVKGRLKTVQLGSFTEN